MTGGWRIKPKLRVVNPEDGATVDRLCLTGETGRTIARTLWEAVHEGGAVSVAMAVTFQDGTTVTGFSAESARRQFELIGAVSYLQARILRDGFA